MYKGDPPKGPPILGNPHITLTAGFGYQVLLHFPRSFPFLSPLLGAILLVLLVLLLLVRVLVHCHVTSNSTITYYLLLITYYSLLFLRSTITLQALLGNPKPYQRMASLQWSAQSQTMPQIAWQSTVAAGACKFRGSRV